MKLYFRSSSFFLDIVVLCPYGQHISNSLVLQEPPHGISMKERLKKDCRKNHDNLKRHTKPHQQPCCIFYAETAYLLKYITQKVVANSYSISHKYLIYYNYAAAMYNYSVTYFYLPEI